MAHRYEPEYFRWVAPAIPPQQGPGTHIVVEYGTSPRALCGLDLAGGDWRFCAAKDWKSCCKECTSNMTALLRKPVKKPKVPKRPAGPEALGYSLKTCSTDELLEELKSRDAIRFTEKDWAPWGGFLWRAWLEYSSRQANKEEWLKFLGGEVLNEMARRTKAAP